MTRPLFARDADRVSSRALWAVDRRRVHRRRADASVSRLVERARDVSVRVARPCQDHRFARARGVRCLQSAASDAAYRRRRVHDSRCRCTSSVGHTRDRRDGGSSFSLAGCSRTCLRPTRAMDAMSSQHIHSHETCFAAGPATSVSRPRPAAAHRPRVDCHGRRRCSRAADAVMGTRRGLPEGSPTLVAYEKYVLRVPNEKAIATTKVELHFPAGLRVTSFADVPGWQLEVVTDSAKAITAAIWTGTLPPQRFIEFPFVARIRRRIRSSSGRHTRPMPMASASNGPVRRARSGRRR